MVFRAPEQLGAIPIMGNKQKFGGYTPSPPPVFSLSNHTGIESTFPFFWGEQLDLFYQVGAKRFVAVKCDTPTADDNYPLPKRYNATRNPYPSPPPFQPHAGQTTAWAPPWFGGSRRLIFSWCFQGQPDYFLFFRDWKPATLGSAGDYFDSKGQFTCNLTKIGGLVSGVIATLKYNRF